MRTEREIQNDNVAGLLKLIKENPDLRVVSMVDSEVVASDDYSSWLGSFGTAEIDYIWNNGERIFFKSHDEEELIQNELDDIDQDVDHSIAEDMAVKQVRSYTWEKVIVVWIGVP